MTDCVCVYIKNLPGETLSYLLLLLSFSIENNKKKERERLFPEILYTHTHKIS